MKNKTITSIYIDRDLLDLLRHRKTQSGDGIGKQIEDLIRASLPQIPEDIDAPLPQHEDTCTCESVDETCRGCADS